VERFSQEPLSRCSHWRASASVGGPNLLTSEDIYHYPPSCPFRCRKQMSHTATDVNESQEGRCMNKQQPSGKRKTSSGTTRTSPSRSRSRLTQGDKAALAQLDHLVDLQRRREQLAASVPPGIETTQEQLANGTVLYHFSHQELGPLGFLRIAPVPYMVPPGMTHVSAEMESSDPDADAQWDKKYMLLQEMVTLCVASLPSSHTVSSPMPTVEEARLQRRLYMRFLACDHSIAMFGLAKALSSREYQVLRAAIENAQLHASPQDRIGIEQRRQELEFYWCDLQDRPSI